MVDIHTAAGTPTPIDQLCPTCKSLSLWAIPLHAISTNGMWTIGTKTFCHNCDIPDRGPDCGC